MPAKHGVFLDQAPADWQIFQQDEARCATIRMAGRYAMPSNHSAPAVYARIVHTGSGVPVAAHLEWQACETRADGTWSGELTRIPAGGLYRLETQLRADRSAGLGGPYCAEWANPGHAPWLQFARSVRRVVGHPIGLLQTSLGGSALNLWNPGEGRPGGAILFMNMLEVVRAAGGRVRGVLWYQGCSDAGANESRSYLARFTEAVAAWRRALNDPALPVITVQINRYTVAQSDAVHDGWSRVREAQRQAARRIPGVYVLPSSDLPLSDIIRTSPAGNLMLGQRAAERALDRVYGAPRDWRAPEIEQAKATPDGRSIRLAVRQVRGVLLPADTTVQPFRITDAAGVVPVARAEYAPEAIVLHLERALQGEATLTLGYGAHPPPFPVDMTRNRPLLACAGVPVEMTA
jgi:hypothetical protein